MAFSPLFIKPVHYRDKSPVFPLEKYIKTEEKDWRLVLSSI